VAASRESNMMALQKVTAHDGLNAMVSRAHEWMNTYGGEDPDEAGMEELRQTNPEAYTIVQALMTKKSLGLLNPKHPNAFGGMLDQPGQKGTMSTKIVDDPPVASLSTIATQHAANQDFINWKPHDDDEDLLGAVAQPKTNAAAAATPMQQASEVLQQAMQPQPAAQPETPKAQAPSNPYLQNVVPTASMSQASVKINKINTLGKRNLLSSFSWDDDDSTSAAAPSAQQATARANQKMLEA